MRSLFLSILALIVFTSCEDVIELDTPTGPERLNVDAHFRVFTDEEPVRFTGNVKLTKTVNFFEDDIPTVSDAIVSIRERGTQNIYLFEESAIESGVYTNNDLSFLNNPDATFDLQVITKDEVYTASAVLMPTAPIVEIEQDTFEIFGKEELELRISIQDNASVDNYYLFDFDFQLYQPLEDEFFNGNQFRFSYVYLEDGLDIETGESIIIINDGIDEQFHQYMELFLELRESGGLFGSPPVKLRGNLINQDNPENFAFGYFRISESDEVEITVQ